MNKISTDVIIVGGGLAGLSLAHQLKTTSPDLEIAVLEKNTFPVPQAIAKIGESTVEIGSHYLMETIGLRQHLQDHHLQKFGLRCFFGSAENDFAKLDELGVSQTFGLPTYQIDRGVIENHLAQSLLRSGVQLVGGVAVKDIQFNKQRHCVTIQHDPLGQDQTAIQAKWLVDAAGRQALLKSKLHLAETNRHQGNACWFRVARRIEIDDWSGDSLWRERCKPRGERWLSTNHLMGPGYWVWIIPLAGDITSIGIVMDDQVAAQGMMQNQATALDWLARNQTRLSTAIAGAELLDFAQVRDYSFGCKQVFSSQRWALTGEAGYFTDPFYSPGSDFIAINNGFVTRLIEAEKSGADIQLESAIYGKLFDSFYQSTLSLYTRQYGGFGDRQMMSLKLVWDYAYYWGVLALLFFQHTMFDIKWMREHSQVLLQAQAFNTQVQTLFQQRARLRRVLPVQGLFINQYSVPCLRHFNATLKKAAHLEPSRELQTNIAMLERLARYVTAILTGTDSGKISLDERDLLGDYRKLLRG